MLCTEEDGKMASQAAKLAAGPAHATLLNPTVKYVLGAGLTGGAIWKMWNVAGGTSYDHEMLGDGAKATPQSQELEK